MNENLPNSIGYKDYEIKPIPMKVIVENNEKWNTQFEIWEHKGYASTVFPFSGKETYSLKEDAIKYCFNAGKHVIDKELIKK